MVEEEVLAGEGDYLVDSPNTFDQMDLMVSTAREVVGKLVTNTEQEGNYEKCPGVAHDQRQGIWQAICHTQSTKKSVKACLDKI